MGKVWMPGGGGGADLDLVTAGKPDVLAGKVIVDKDGEPLTGTMPNIGAVSQALNAGGSYTVPVGYHNGSGKITANSLASQTLGTATSAHILSGQSAWVNGNKVDGAIPWQNADVSGTDRAWSQGMSNWAGTINLKVRNGHYLNGVNWIQQDVPEYQPRNIKKGVNIGGVVGTFEGYVPGVTDLYYRGNNVSGWTSGAGWSFQAGQILISGATNSGICSFSTVGRSYLNIEGSTVGYGGASEQVWTLQARPAESWTTIGSVRWREYGYYVKSIDVTSAQMNVEFRLQGNFTQDTIFRIWLS